MNLGGRLKQARLHRKMTQEQLAASASTNDLPISQAMLSALENRDSETTTALFAFARALRVSPEWLQTGNGESGLEPAPKLEPPASLASRRSGKATSRDGKPKQRTG